MTGSGETYRLEGNDDFAKGEWSRAIRSYSRALDIVQDDKRVYSNRSAARVRLAESLRPGDDGERDGLLRSAIEDADKVIELDPNWSKGYYRKARALELLEKKKDRAAGASTQANPRNSGGVGTGGDVPSKTVLMLGSLGCFHFRDDPILKDHKSHLLKKGFRVEAMRFKAGAVVEKLRSGRIGACVVTQVMNRSPSDLFRHEEWLATLSLWVRQGGVFVVAPGDQSKLCEHIFKGCFDLPWVFQGDFYRRTDHRLKDLAWQTEPDLPTDYNVKACSLSGVAPSDRLYSPRPGATTQSLVFAPIPVDPNMAPVAVAEVGEGIVAFLGDVNWEEKTREILRHLVSLRIDAADGPQLDTTDYDVCESSDDNRSESDEDDDDDIDNASDDDDDESFGDGGGVDLRAGVINSNLSRFNQDGGFGEFSPFEVEMLLEQGVHPWDEDAGATLAALKRELGDWSMS